ncbi:MAG: DUF4352 domain-containing protein [Micromonosporaceae bacterium]|nr:DUF4352 domain-containing protein [Micromonosporaceae bacterium]
MVEPTLIMPPVRPRRRWGRTALLTVGLVVLGCCVAGATAAVVSSALNRDGGAGPGGAGPATAPAVPGFGDPVRDGQFEFVVSGLTCGHAELVNGILRAQAQGQFCVVDLSVGNIGDEPRHFADGAQKAYGPNGHQYAADTHAGVVANGNGAAVWNVINPGNAVQAKIVFDIPPTASITTLELHDSPFSGGVRVAVSAT